MHSRRLLVPKAESGLGFCSPEFSAVWRHPRKPREARMRPTVSKKVKRLSGVFVLSRFGWWLKTHTADAAWPEAAFVRVADHPDRATGICPTRRFEVIGASRRRIESVFYRRNTGGRYPMN
jgi:hypothetical protein